MRIIDKNRRDYYDSIQRTGVDRSIVYVRETKEITPGHNYDSRMLKMAVIGFCGKTHPLVYYVDTLSIKSIIHAFYQLEELRKFIQDNPEYRNDKYGEHFESYARHNYMYEWFAKYNVPIFFYKNYTGELTVNPILEPWHFYRVFDAWTAFQELSMYCGGVLNNPMKEIPKMKDGDMALIKGFDKYSFRKDKQNK